MGTILKPMLAVNIDDIDSIIYPVLCTPKLDGIRCLVTDKGAVTRNFKPFPNNHIRELVSKLPEGFDGEIIVKGKKFNEITHEVMSEDGEPDFTYCVFDWCKDPDEPYDMRMEHLADCKVPKFVEKILPHIVTDKKTLLYMENEYLKDGFEGLMMRLPNSPYKMGRSTLREFFLIKLKRFAQDEAIVLELLEQMENTNAKTKDAFGDSKRSSELAGMIPKNTLGALRVKDIKSGIEFCIGSGFDDEQRKEIWNHKKNYIGKIITYTHQESGAKELPRFPVWKGFRDKKDMSE